MGATKPQTEDPKTTNEPVVETEGLRPPTEAEVVRGSGTVEEQAAAREADPTDLGVPQNPGETFAGPEDAYAPDTRGDYSDRTAAPAGGSYEMVAIPEDERVPGGPTVQAIRQA